MYLISNVFLGKFQFLTWMYDHIFKETNNNKKKNNKIP
jgi:nitrate reductase NapE component